VTVRYLMYWLALGAAGIALNAVFALLGFGSLHRGLQQSKIEVKGGSTRQRMYIWSGAAAGLVVGLAISVFFGPFSVVWALMGIRAPRRPS
jgi:hypothetical protein